MLPGAHFKNHVQKHTFVPPCKAPLQLLISFVILAVGWCHPEYVISQPAFTDVTQEAGIEHIFEVFEGIFGGGAAVIDFDQDGWEDVFITGGQGQDVLLRNNADGTFEEIQSRDGLEALDNLVTQGVVSADVNKDGWPDLFISTVAEVKEGSFTEAPNVLLINNRQGSFYDGTAAWGLTEATFSTGAAFGDVNRDGYPDLYVCNYFENYEGRLDQFEGPVQDGSTGPGRDLFYINNVGTGFVESSETYGITRKGLTFQGLWTDFDNDNDLDILIANDFGNRGTPNLIYRNEFPKPTFTEIGEAQNFDYGINGMGIGVCDINQDGWLDYLVTNIQVSPFFINQGPNAPFLEESVQRGAGFFSVGTNDGFRVVPVSWGVNFFDMDHDMDSDLYISNGCLNPSLAPNPNLLLENIRGRFVERGFFTQTNDPSIGRGSVSFDYDQDGDLDLLVVNQTPHKDHDLGIVLSGTKLYRNDLPGGTHWLQVQLKGHKSEAQGIGSRVEAYVDGELLVQEVYGGSSHESQNSTRIHFGLGDNRQVDSLVIRWSASEKQVVPQIAANQLIQVEEESQLFEVNSTELVSFPIPFDSELTVRIPEVAVEKPGVMSLYNLLGQEVFRKAYPELPIQIRESNLSGLLPKSVYVLQLTGDSFSYVQHIMKAP